MSTITVKNAKCVIKTNKIPDDIVTVIQSFIDNTDSVWTNIPKLLDEIMLVKKERFDYNKFKEHYWLTCQSNTDHVYSVLDEEHAETRTHLSEH